MLKALKQTRLLHREKYDQQVQTQICKYYIINSIATYMSQPPIDHLQGGFMFC